ncbi:MAG: family 78 glycoside hydrolase catalytic domain [Clostridia bacterium]
MKIMDMTVEYQTNPIGIDTDCVRFGWKMVSDKIGSRQTAYEIRVYEKDGDTLVWDSGMIKDSHSVGIKYEGDSLGEATAYKWSVTIWDEMGLSFTSDEAIFETSVTNQKEWKEAKFICMNKSSSAPIFRTEQKLVNENISSARLYITALGVYKAYVNGNRVCAYEDGKRVYHHMNPGYGNGNVSLGYQTYDVTDFIEGESVVLSAMCGTGWYNSMSATSSQPALKALLTITYKSGEKQYISTDTDNWKGTIDGPITENGVYYGENYDARLAKKLGDFTLLGYDDSCWVSGLEKDIPVIENTFPARTARYVRLSVSETGPAVKADKENRLQIMELELLDEKGNNAAYGIVPEVSDEFTWGSQWIRANISDGDKGYNSDKGYSSTILGRGQTSLSLDKPITFTFDLSEKTQINTLRIYPRVTIESINGNECVNYPKKYTIEVSSDGENWETIGEYEIESLKNTTMSTTEFEGDIRSQMGTVGKIIDEYSTEPQYAVLYTTTNENSQYEGGEIKVDEYYAFTAPEDSLYSGAYIPVKEGQKLFDGGIVLKKGQTMVVDMGQNMSAVPEIEFSAPKGTQLTMCFGEMLNDGSAVGTERTQADGPKGSIYQKSLRNARSKVNYIFSGDEKEHYMPSMSFFGYRYVGITATDDVTIYSLKSKALSSVNKKTGYIHTNNENVNKLFSNTLYGQLSNYFTTATDCNQRDERLFWSGDTQAFAQTAVYNFNSLPFLNDLQDILSENTMRKGYVPSVVDNDGYFSNWAAGWSDVLIILPWTLYKQTGDKNILSENYKAMERYMEYLKENERSLNQSPLSHMNFGDWLSFQGTCIEVMSDYYYGYVTKIMAEVASILGDEEGKTKYEQKFEDIKNKFLSTHVTFEKGNLTIKSGTGDTSKQFGYREGKGGKWEDNSQTALLWMLKLKFYSSEEMHDAALDLLTANIKNENPSPYSVRYSSGKNTLAVGFLGSNVLLPVLSDEGCTNIAYDLLLQDENPSWLFEVKAGATTVWERWNSFTPGKGFGDCEMNSFNHYAYGSVVEWMYKYMAGISADENVAGFKKIVLQPSCDFGRQYNTEDRVTSVYGSYNSYYGDIESVWESDGDKLTFYKAVIPANTSATLYLPVSGENMKNFKEIDGVVFEKITEHNSVSTAKFYLSSGGYEFTIDNNGVSVSHTEGYFSDGKNISLNEDFEISVSTEETEESMTISYDVCNTSGAICNARLIAAVYNSDSSMENVKMKEVVFEKGMNQVKISVGKTPFKIRSFVWGEGEKPLTRVLELN